VEAGSGINPILLFITQIAVALQYLRCARSREQSIRVAIVQRQFSDQIQRWPQRIADYDSQSIVVGVEIATSYRREKGAIGPLCITVPAPPRWRREADEFRRPSSSRVGIPNPWQCDAGEC
jgi:hypothetical protein